MRTLALLYVLVYCTTAHTQPVQRWMGLFDRYGAPELISGVTLVNDTTYRIANSWQNGAVGHISPAGISSEGDTLWRREYVNQMGAFQPGATHAALLPDGRWYWTGGVFPTGGGEPDGALFCFDENGDSLWFKTYPTPEYDGFNGMAALPDGGTCLVGVQDGGFTDIYVVRTDPNGDTLWTRTHGGTTSETGYSIAPTADFGFAVGAGRWNTNDDIATLLLKIDQNGDLVWQRTYGTPWRDNGCSVTELPDGGFALATAFGVAPVPNTRRQATLIRTDNQGFQQWTSTLNDSIHSFYGAAPLVTADGSFVVSGGRDGAGTRIGMLVKMDPTGTVLWERNYLTNPNIDQYIYDLRRTLDGGFIMAGTAFDTVPPLSQDAWLIKTDSFGCIVPGCQVFDAVLEQYTSLQGALQVSPNPTSDVVQVSIDLPLGLVVGNDAMLTLVDAQGRKVMEQALPTLAPSHPHTLSLSHLPSGLYFLHLTNGKRWLAGSRVVRQ